MAVVPDGHSKLFNSILLKIICYCLIYSYAYKWQMSGGILPADKYPYLDVQGKCTYNKADIVAYVDTPYKFDFTSVNGNASFVL